MSWFKHLTRWFRLILDPRRTYGHTFVEDPPDELSDAVVYLVGDDPTTLWSAQFKCPCACGETIALSLIPRDDPSWKATVTRQGKITLYPSVWRIKGCRSHFFIRDGRVLWAIEDDRRA